MANLSTRAGVQPTVKKLPYEISTQMVREYLQKKLDVVLERKTAGKEQMSLMLYTVESGRNFIPFMLLLPTEALYDAGDRSDDSIHPIFNTNGNRGSLNLRSEIYNMIKPYVFTSADQDAFFSEDWRRRTKVPRDASPILKKMSTAHIMKINGGRDEVVAIMLDPIRVFYDMLKDTNDKRENQPFTCDVVNWHKHKTGEFLYVIERVTRKGKGKQNYDGDSIANDLNRAMRGGRQNRRR